MAHILCDPGVPTARFGRLMALAARLLAVAGRSPVAVVQAPLQSLEALDNPFPNRPRILVVDDDGDARQSTCDILRRWGITATAAGDGAEAVAIACGHDFDLILMDLQMPLMDGLTATSQIRRFERENACARAPVVAYTASPVGSSLLAACGIDAVLDKPCDARQLQECMLRWCPPW